MRKKALLFLALFMTALVGVYLLTIRNNSLTHGGKKSGVTAGVVDEKQGITENNEVFTIITKARLLVEYDRIRVVIEDNQNDTVGVKYRYEWTKNGRPFGIDSDSITGFQKEDKIAVKITPFDHEKEGRAILLSMDIAQAPLRIIENKTISFDGNVLAHQVKAADPDGGSISYSLIDAPRNMTIDSKTGLINWHVQQGDHGKYSVSVQVKNDRGAEVVCPLNIDIGKSND